MSHSLSTADLSRAYVIGMGEVGRRLATALETGGVEVVAVTRDGGWEAASGTGEGLRLVCVREEALSQVLPRLANVPGKRLVLIQNGWIRPLLAGRPGVTRGLIWFRSKGELLEVLRPSPFYGPAADHLSGLLSRGGLPSQSVSRTDFDLMDADKMGFNCVVGLPLAVHGVSLGTYLNEHAREARAVFTEALLACANALGCTPSPHHWNRFLGSVRPLHEVRASTAKALELRNGAVVKLASSQGQHAVVNQRLLEAIASR